ncbi:MAG: exo-beta-N-acetylmuramidase NamZ family protein [Armatimonadota bacterium]
MPIVRTGLDILIHDQPDSLRGCRTGLVTNHSAVLPDLTHIIDAMLKAEINIKALFSPEHGIRGDIPDGCEIASGIDGRTGIPIYSLYGASKKPSPEMLKDIDVMIFDIQDIGCRYYTFIWTMAYVIQACAENNKPLIILDRPNPVTGAKVEGNILDPDFASFVGLYPVPVRHGLTVGEMALYLNGEYGFGADISVVACEGLTRDMWFSDTGLPWVPPSPNMPSPDTALIYPGTCLFEGTNISEGRGTAKPFEIIGAPWIDGYKLAEQLNDLCLPGVRFRPVWFIPSTSKHQKESCSGVQIHITDRNSVQPIKVGLNMIRTLLTTYPSDFQFRESGNQNRCFFDLLAGTDQIRLSLLENSTVDDITELWYDSTEHYMSTSNRYMIYK